MMRRLTVASLMIALLSPSFATAQERFGTIAGTWQACQEDAAALRLRVDRTAQNPLSSQKLVAHLERRLTVELDRCVQLGDAPVSAYQEVISRYRDHQMDDRALSLGLKALKTFGELAELQLVVGQILYKKGEHDRAIGFINKVVESNPRSPEGNALLGSHWYARGDFVKALPYLRVAADLNPNVFETNAALGDACLRTNDLPCAGEFLERASALRPTDVLLSIKVGDLQRELGQWGPAIAAYDRALKTDAGRWDGHYGIGRTYAAAGLTESAQASLVRASDLAPGNREVAVAASRVLRNMGRSTLGVTVLRRAVEASGTDAPSTVELTLSLLDSGDVAGASRTVTGLPAEVEADDRVMAVRGDVFLATRKPAEALELYNKAEQKRGKVSPYALRQARALRALGRYEEAVQTLEPRVEDPAVVGPLVTALIDLARSQVQRNRLDDARRSVDRALKLSPDSPGAQLAAASLAMATKEYEAGASLLGKTPKSAEHDLLASWLEYGRGAPEKALALLPPKGRPATRRAARALEVAALVKLERPVEALAKLDAAQVADDQPLLELRSYAAARAVEAHIRGGRFADALSLGAKEPGERQAAGYRPWLVRALAVSNVALGQPIIGGASGPADAGLDPVLAAMARYGQNDLDGALKALGGVRTSAQSTHLQAWLQAELGTKSFNAGKGQAARTQAAAVADASTLPVELQMNLVVIKHGASSELSNAIAPFVQKAVPEALFNASVMATGSAARASATEWLTQLLTLQPSPALKARAEALLELKRRIY